jgi:hypothetical protein
MRDDEGMLPGIEAEALVQTGAAPCLLKFLGLFPALRGYQIAIRRFPDGTHAPM